MPSVFWIKMQIRSRVNPATRPFSFEQETFASLARLTENCPELARHHELADEIARTLTKIQDMANELYEISQKDEQQI